MKALDDVEAGHELGRYELLAPVARGGMASVWAARLKGTRGFQKLVAIKTMLPDISDDPEFEQMFLNEASLASRIRHPHAVEIFDLGEQDGLLYLVMEWVEGEPLNVVLNHAVKQGGVPLPVAVRILIDVCSALHAAHELRDESGAPVGLVHRDVSPHNVLVSYDGVVKLVDFGVAKATARLAPHTSQGQVRGKIPYMAPEQISAGVIDRRVDVFAAGILLYLLTTGRHPFKGENRDDTVRAICSPKPVTAPSRASAGYPKVLERVLLKALAKDADQRFATAAEFAEALERSLPPTSRPASDRQLGEYLGELLAERRVRRHEQIRNAIRAADERPGAPRRSRSQLTPFPESNSSMRAVVVSSPDSEFDDELGAPGRNSPTVPATAAPQHTTGAMRRPIGRVLVALAVAGALLASGLLLLNQRPSALPAQSASPVVAPSTPEAVQPAPPTAPTPSDEKAPLVDQPSAGADAGAEKNGTAESPHDKPQRDPKSRRKLSRPTPPRSTSDLKTPY